MIAPGNAFQNQYQTQYKHTSSELFRAQQNFLIYVVQPKRSEKCLKSI